MDYAHLDSIIDAVDPTVPEAAKMDFIELLKKHHSNLLERVNMIWGVLLP